MERVNKEVPTVGILSKEGVVLGAEKKELSKLLDESKPLLIVSERNGENV